MIWSGALGSGGGERAMTLYRWVGGAVVLGLIAGFVTVESTGVAIASTSSAAVATGYTLFDLGSGSEPMSENASGVVAGTSEAGVTVWRRGVATTLSTPSGNCGISDVHINASNTVAATVESCPANFNPGVGVPYVWQPTDGVYGAPVSA
jgi:hypothetical protein